MTRFFLLAVIMLFVSFQGVFGRTAPEPDSAYIFAYSTLENGGRNGLHFAWSTDRENWHPIGPKHSFVKSDYGTWGGEKRMYDPFLYQDNQGLWHLVFSVNDRDGTFAHTTSRDLILWQPQAYPEIIEDNNCLNPEISYNEENNNYRVSWLSNKGDERRYYEVTTGDLIHYSSPEEISEAQRLNKREEVQVREEIFQGTVHKVKWKEIQQLIDRQKLVAFNQQRYHEQMKDDPRRFANLKELDAQISVDLDAGKEISDELMGIFFEDINYGADGGLYAELVQNRGFEYDPSDTKGQNKDWNSYYAWRLKNSDEKFAIDSVNPIHKNNKHYAVLNIDNADYALINEGFDGIALKEGEKYDFSMFAFNPDGVNKKVAVRLVGPDGGIYGEKTINIKSDEWKKHKTVIKANGTVADAHLEINPLKEGKMAVDMISLFPQNTFKGRENGLRADLAQVIADIKPRFVRFPGGCVAHGDGIDNIYRWKNTIGPLETRKPQRNIWNYHQSMGLGFYEYFLFCEDLDAEPIPIVAAGVPCQNSSCGGAGQQGGIPMNEMDAYVQDVLDLIEWANGDKDTEWGRKRAEAGHPEPFGLKYLGVGNEDLITHVFEERFEMIYNAVKEKHPEIVVIGTVGPFSEGSDYERGWEFATELDLPMVDEHYYQPPGWFIHNQDFYDQYDRSKSAVYLGEYAAHLPGRPVNIETALVEALHLTNLERNADVVKMSSYAPLLAKEGRTQWNPDLIYFNNSEVKPTVSYFVQKLFGQNAGETYYQSTIDLSDNNEDVYKRVNVSVVRDSETNDLIVKMVNLLPVEVNTDVVLDGVTGVKSDAVHTVLTGAPDDRNARPETGTIQVGETFNCSLPAYSVSIIRIETE